MTRCASCEWAFEGAATVIGDVPFCCTGCADSGPCTCTYGSGVSGEPPLAARRRRGRPAGWALIDGRAGAADAADDEQQRRERRARLGSEQ